MINQENHVHQPNKLTMNDILDKVKGATYTVLPDGRTTICQLTLENGFSVEGKSACVDIANFNKATGEQYAYNNAVDKIWELEGYLLAETLYRQRVAGASSV